MVSQVPVIGILMIVNGSLQLIMGVVYAAMGPLFMTMFNRQAPAPPPQAAQIEQIFTVMSIVYVVLGSVVAIAGCINIAGGISALRFRSRAFVITALFFNILPMITCYCLPTSLGLMIWGLIVMFQSDVGYAFTLGASGYTADEIKQRMSRGGFPGDPRRDDWDDRDRRNLPPDGSPRPNDKNAPPQGSVDDENFYNAEQPPKPDADRPPPRDDPDADRFFEK